MDINKIKTLRSLTGAGLVEIKNALEKSEGNLELALTVLNQLNKKTDANLRVASKGITSVVIKDNQAILFEVNAETDFAHKNAFFIDFIEQLAHILIASDVTNPKTALKVQFGDQSVEEKINHTSGLIKETLILRRLYRIIKTKDQTFGSYIHLGGKVSTLVIIDQNQPEIAAMLALQVAAHAPLYLDLSLMDNNTLNYEKFMFEKQMTHHTSFDTYLSELILLEQPLIKKSEILVKDYLKEKKTQVIDFFRFELGQGIEDKLNCRLEIPCDGSKITVKPVN